MEDLIKESKEWKDKADQLLRDTDILNDLGRYGEVVLSGAYAGGVMMHGDIDLYVVRDEVYTSEEVVSVLGDLYKQGKFRSYFIKGDWDDPRLGEEFPNGHYVGMKIRRGEEKWVFDVWFVSRKEFENRNEGFHIDQIDLTDEQKVAILSLKKQRNDRNLSLSGQEIYKGVLEDGVADISELTG